MPLTTSPLPLSRPEEIAQFLAPYASNMTSLSFLAGDASFRKYYRLQIENRPVVLMDAPPPEDPAPFIQIAEFLLSHGFSSPEIIASDLDKGFILLEDFGDQTYTKALSASPNRSQELYFLAIDTLIDLHKEVAEKPVFLKDYTTETHLAEAMLLIQWTYPAIKDHDPAKSLLTEYKALWENALLKANEAPRSIVLRDFHVDNLMILPDREGISQCGLLDFQDALWGSVTYDIVSLLEDARRDIPTDLIEACWTRYFDAYPNLESTAIRRQGTILSAARHAKIIGIFTRLAVRDNKSHYLGHIPRVWHLLQKCLEDPILSDLNHWFAQHFPLEERIIPLRFGGIPSA